MGKPKKQIPDRWTEYKPMGNQISGTRILAFKTPLDMARCEHLSNSSHIFTTRTLMDHCSALGLVIDLTCLPTGYYNRMDLKNNDIDFKHILVPGQVIPKDKYVFQFFRAVEKFIEENQDNDKLIGVHCTHGINRTGYIICRYMIECLNVPADQAIIEFNSARGHDQERAAYLQSLRNTTHNNKKYQMWCNGKHLQLNLKDRPLDNKKWSSNRAGYQDDDWRSPSSSSARRNNKRSLDDLQSSEHAGFGYQPAKRQKHNTDLDDSFTPTRKCTRSSLSSPNTPVDGHGQHGKRYYQNYYKGNVRHQYDVNFYQDKGSGLGPHRLSPRNAYSSKSGVGFRQYHGPNAHRAPYQRR